MCDFASSKMMAEVKAAHAGGQLVSSPAQGIVTTHIHQWSTAGACADRQQDRVIESV